MTTVLLAWIGRTDLRASEGVPDVGAGPISQAMESRAYDRALLLSTDDAGTTERYLAWLRGRVPSLIATKHVSLRSPTDFGDIYHAAVAACQQVLVENGGPVDLVFHLSPGTPAMAAIWMILGKTRFPATLIESSKQQGVKIASVPFDISADFLPDVLQARDERLRRSSAEPPPDAPEFADIIHRSPVMARLIQRARRVASRNVPILIEGESGTGKELLARAIHRASPRHGGPFIAVNCGAIAKELLESELFGHERGAFTGAAVARPGYFEAASGGTLLLDEVGELPLEAQVKLLRVLQQGEVVRVGATSPRVVDVRIVAATNRTLVEEIAKGRFREDLFYRLAVAVLLIPPLRERGGDLALLLKRLWEVVEREASGEPGFEAKHLSAGAQNAFKSHAWPGNVRELLNTLRRAALWTEGTTVTADDAREAILPAVNVAPDAILGRPLGTDASVSLPSLIDEVERHYLQRAMLEAHGNKKKAAELLGLPSYQTLTNWLRRHGLETPVA